MIDQLSREGWDRLNRVGLNQLSRTVGSDQLSSRVDSNLLSRVGLDQQGSDVFIQLSRVGRDQLGRVA